MSFPLVGFVIPTCSGNLSEGFWTSQNDINERTSRNDREKGGAGMIERIKIKNTLVTNFTVMILLILMIGQGMLLHVVDTLPEELSKG